MAHRIVVLASGSGTLLQALLDACASGEVDAEVVGVGTDRPGGEALERAGGASIPTFVLRVSDFATRGEWDVAMRDRVDGFHPDLVVSAGFMKLVGPAFLERFGGRMVNTHPALLPSFPGVHAPRDALAHGVKVTGATIFLVDAGVDTGRILGQVAVPVLPGDTVESLHERIKVVERQLLVDTVASWPPPELRTPAASEAAVPSESSLPEQSQKEPRP